MAVAAVTADNTRVNPADAVLNWGNDGGGGGVAIESDITYQNAAAMSRKISTSRIGRDYTHGSGTDTTATGTRHWMLKLTVTNPGVLLSRTSPALGVKIGSASGAYYEVYIAGNDNYPPRGGWLLIPVSVNVSGYRDATTGSPTLTSVLYWSVLADFSAGSKAENVAIDAIDYGAGLHLVGGDGASTDAVFQDLIDFDEGTVANRYGYVFTEGAIMFANGKIAIGRNTSGTAVATVFQDTGKVVTWKNGYAETGFHRLLIDLGSAATDVDIIGATLISEGEKDNSLGLGYSTTEDTRTILEVVGTSGAFDLTSTSIQNFQDVILTSAVTVDGCDIATESLTQATAEIANTKIRTGSITSVATITDPTFGASAIHDVDFIQAGAGHAVELSAVGATVTLSNVSWTGYGADTTDSAAIDVTAATGTTTINWSGGNAPTYKSAGATVVVQSVITITYVNLANGSTIEVFETGTSTKAAGTTSVTGGQFAAGLQASTGYDAVLIEPGKEPVRRENVSYTVTQSVDLNQQNDPNYEDL